MNQSRHLDQLAAVSVLVASICTALIQTANPPQKNTDNRAHSSITLPAGTRIVLAVVRPIATKSVNPGEVVYLQTTFPVIANNKLAIPAGTFVQGVLAAVPNRQKHQIDLPLQAAVLIFGNGYTVTLPGASGPAAGGASAGQSGGVTASVDRSNDSSVLDVGSSGEIVMSAPLTLEGQSVAAALHESNRLLAVHDLLATSRPMQNQSGTCYTPEVPPKPEVVTVGSYMIETQTIAYTTSTPAVRAKPGTPYPCP